MSKRQMHYQTDRSRTQIAQQKWFCQRGHIIATQTNLTTLCKELGFACPNGLFFMLSEANDAKARAAGVNVKGVNK